MSAGVLTNLSGGLVEQRNTYFLGSTGAGGSGGAGAPTGQSGIRANVVDVP